MGSNAFGKQFVMTTWGESHGPAIGVIIDGCPAGLAISSEEIDAELSLRAPGKSPFTSPRSEPDTVEILSGVLDGMTTGAPIALMIRNRDADSSKYSGMEKVLKPGHAQYTYLEKYGCFDDRGGGRASARETACRVAAGAIARKLLQQFSIEVAAGLCQVGEIATSTRLEPSSSLRNMTYRSPLFCGEPETTVAMTALLEKTMNAGDSVGGAVEFVAWNLPSGLGEPVYDKLQARLAYALMGLPAARAFEIGSGFSSLSMNGSKHNDPFIHEGNQISTSSNNAGGVLGGISTGMPLYGKVAFKPASSIKALQQTVTVEGDEALWKLPEGSRHDPCVAIRAVPVVEAMVCLELADALLRQRCARL